MMWKTIIVFITWMQIWRLAAYAGQINSPFILGLDVLLAYMMVVVWFPIFKQKSKMEDMDDKGV